MFPRSVAFVPVIVMAVLSGAGRAQAQSAPPANFQGAYVGAHLGGGSGSGSRANTSGMVGGLQGGYNAQSGQIVVGGEADLSASGYSHRGLGQSYKQGVTGTARARVGAVFDRVLVYGTGGLALQNNTYKDAITDTSKSHAGTVFGAGAEVMMSQNVTVRGEYLRYDFNRQGYNTALGQVKISPDMNVFRGGLNYKF